tara:strand:- start:3577 stop:4413 length:837 start_codon:yes stop_codon:yes gene_type:complete
MTIENEKKKIQDFSKEIKKKILKMAYVAGAHSSHFGGALSIVDIISFLFCSHMNIKKDDPTSSDRDRFILSKGHACLAYYAALSQIGFIKEKDLETFELDGSDLLGHPVINRDIGIEFSNGSLGMGLSLAIGVAIALKKKRKNNKIFVILGDGESNEGSVWEASMAAVKFNLDNIFLIVDKNNFQQTGTTQEIMNSDNLQKKWESFGWNVNSIDGHNIDEMIKYFSSIKYNQKPNALIMNTIKGKGFSFSENNNDWHHAILTKKLYEEALKELESNAN